MLYLGCAFHRLGKSLEVLLASPSEPVMAWVHDSESKVLKLAACLGIASSDRHGVEDLTSTSFRTERDDHSAPGTLESLPRVVWKFPGVSLITKEPEAPRLGVDAVVDLVDESLISNDAPGPAPCNEGNRR
jgi:hypothetical protein